MHKNITLSLLTTLTLFPSLYAQERLQDIEVISATKTQQSLQSTTANIDIITAQEIKENGYQSIAQALEHKAGFSITTNGGIGTVSSIFLRGMKTEKILVLLDGISLNNPSSTDGQAFFEHISIDTIEQIEIIKGGASAVWGADASAGVINIITKKAKAGIHANALLSYGSFKTKKASAFISYKKDSIDAILSTSNIKTDGFSATLPRGDEADGYKNHTLNFKLAYTFLEQHKINFTSNYIDANSQYDGAFSELKANDDIANIDTTQKDFSLQYLFTSNNYSSNLRAINQDSNRVDFSNSSFGNAKIKYDATQKEIEWIQQYHYHQSSIILGLNTKETKGVYQYNDTNATQNSFHDKALFLTLAHQFKDFTEGKNRVELSLRQDFFSQFENKLSYKIGAKHFYKRVEGLSSTFNYYQSIDAPNSYQVANTLIGNRLNPDTTKGYDIGIGYKNLSFTYFFNQIDNKLGYFSDNVNFVYGYINNKGLESTKGMEIELSHAFNDLGLILATNYTHLFKYKSEEGNKLDKRVKDTLNSSINYYFKELFTLGIDAQYIGDRVEFEQNTGNYTLWNSNLTLTLIKNLDLSFHAKNIFNKKYETTLNYATPARSFYTNLNYSF